MFSEPRCPHCRSLVYLDALSCPECDGELAYDPTTLSFRGIRDQRAVIDGRTWFTCSNRIWLCNWLVRDDAPAGRCIPCRLTRERPDSDDTIALAKYAATEQHKRRLLLQLFDLGLPVLPWYVEDGGLGFDLLSSISLGRPVLIGHANGIVTLDLAESLDDHRESLRVRLGEPYRTMLGHLRHEVGHYFQNVLIPDDRTWARCRELFGDERGSYQDALDRHYRTGAPEGWAASYISEYATMHPWEDFAETFAHYLHITATLQTASVIGLHLHGQGFATGTDPIEPLASYAEESVHRLLGDWQWMSRAFNRINRAMGLGDLYPFEIAGPVRTKLGFVHDLVTRARVSREEQLGLLLGSPAG